MTTRFRFFNVTNKFRVVIISYVPNQIRIHESFQPFLNGKMTIVFCHFSQPNVKCNIDKLSKYAWGGVKVNGSLEVKKERCERDKFPDFLWQKIIFIPFSNQGILFNLHVSCKPYFRCSFFHTIASCKFLGCTSSEWQPHSPVIVASASTNYDKFQTHQTCSLMASSRQSFSIYD